RTRFGPGAEAIFLEGRASTLKLQPSFNKFFRQIILTSAICSHDFGNRICVQLCWIGDFPGPQC
ncbi:unnamed protein product, partial [Allacma fusca]